MQHLSREMLSAATSVDLPASCLGLPLLKRATLFACLSLPSLPLLAADAASPAALYGEHCAGCHGRDGKAQTRLGKKSGAKDLTDKKALQRLSDADLAKVIQLGRKNAKGEELMEPFGKVLSEKQIESLVPFVRAFSK